MLPLCEAHADNRHARIERGDQLDQAPRTREHRFRLDEDENVRVLDVLDEVVQVAQIVRVQEGAPTR